MISVSVLDCTVHLTLPMVTVMSLVLLLNPVPVTVIEPPAPADVELTLVTTGVRSVRW